MSGTSTLIGMRSSPMRPCSIIQSTSSPRSSSSTSASPTARQLSNGLSGGPRSIASFLAVYTTRVASLKKPAHLPASFLWYAWKSYGPFFSHTITSPAWIC